MIIWLAVCGACKVGKLIPLFTERKPATPRVSRMAVAKPRGEDDLLYLLIVLSLSIVPDSPHPIVGNPKVPDTLVRNQSPSPSTELDEDITDLVNTLKDISIDKTTDPPF
jgi:hypothetical protein